MLTTTSTALRQQRWRPGGGGGGTVGQQKTDNDGTEGKTAGAERAADGRQSDRPYAPLQLVPWRRQRRCCVCAGLMSLNDALIRPRCEQTASRQTPTFTLPPTHSHTHTSPAHPSTPRRQFCPPLTHWGLGASSRSDEDGVCILRVECAQCLPHGPIPI